MNRTTIMLPQDLKHRAFRHARNRGLSLGELIRKSLERWLKGEAVPAEEDPFWDDQTIYKGRTPRDLAKKHDRYLYDDPE